MRVVYTSIKCSPAWLTDDLHRGYYTKTPHLAPQAKSVIWLFMEGGPSHLDTFDPKPLLQELAGKPMPASFGRPITAMGTASNALMPSRRTFKPYGQSGHPRERLAPERRRARRQAGRDPFLLG